MLRCDDCGYMFDEPDYCEESRGEFWGMPAFEKIACCPCCGSDDLDYDVCDYEDEEEDEDEDV